MGAPVPEVAFRGVDRVFVLTGRVLYVSATNTAFRRSAFPGYDSTLTQGGDELDLLRRLRRRGRVVWDCSNIVTTSSRRLQKGLLYTFFVSFLTFYMFAYLVNRVSSQQILGMAPVFRQERRPRQRPRRGRGSSSPARAGLGPPRRALSSTGAAILRVRWPNRLSWRAVLALALFVPIWAGLASYALSVAIEHLMRFWTGL